MQTGLDRESSSLMDLESQKRLAHERLEEMDQQHSKLEGMLSDMKQKYQEESHKVREYISIKATCTLTHTHAYSLTPSASTQVPLCLTHHVNRKLSWGAERCSFFH